MIEKLKLFQSKLFSKNDAVKECVQTTEKLFSGDIRRQFVLEKCSKVTFRKGLVLKPKKITRYKHVNYRVRHNKTSKYFKLIRRMVSIKKKKNSIGE